jgi:hypothetical protein
MGRSASPRELRKHESSCLPNPNDRADHLWPARRASDGHQELGWTFEKIGLGTDGAVRQRQNEQGARNANRIGGQVYWQNRREMVIHGTALVARIGGTMLVVTAVLMAVIDGTGACDIVGNGDLALVKVMEVHAEERCDTDNLRDKIETHNPRDHQPFGAG